MLQDEFIKEFVIKYPKLYVRALSFNFPFTEQEVLKYGFLLAWDNHGILGNSYINWTKKLQQTFQSRLDCKDFGPPSQKYVPHPETCWINEHNSVIKLRPFAKNDINEIKFSDLNIKLMWQYKDRIQDWATISANFDLTFNEVLLFLDKIHRDMLLVNPNINWTNTLFYQLYKDMSYPACTCKNIWYNFVNNHVDSFTIPIHLDAFNRLDKFIKINWKTDVPFQDDNFKYLIGVYVKSEYGCQLMSSGYYFSRKHFYVGQTFDMPTDRKFPISNSLIYSGDI